MQLIAEILDDLNDFLRIGVSNLPFLGRIFVDVRAVEAEERCAFFDHRSKSLALESLWTDSGHDPGSCVLCRLDAETNPVFHRRLLYLRSAAGFGSHHLLNWNIHGGDGTVASMSTSRQRRRSRRTCS